MPRAGSGVRRPAHRRGPWPAAEVPDPPHRPSALYRRDRAVRGLPQHPLTRLRFRARPPSAGFRPRPRSLTVVPSERESVPRSRRWAPSRACGAPAGYIRAQGRRRPPFFPPPPPAHRPRKAASGRACRAFPRGGSERWRSRLIGGVDGAGSPPRDEHGLVPNDKALRDSATPTVGFR